ncbi:MAG TPA: N-acetylmuramidase domain-containing protein [Pseudomonadales bacterium]|nr:N-acetylmuramidase domain-containing protein [Pseudomonadales bacterium]
MSDNVSPNPTATLAPTLFDVIAWVETKTNCKLIRFEPATYQKLSTSRTDSEKLIISNIQKACECSWGTALMICCTSWGATQIMGFNLWGPLGYTKSAIDFLENEADQHVMFLRFLRANKLGDFTPAMLAQSNDARHHFAAVYNGADSYADLIAQALAHFGLSVNP